MPIYDYLCTDCDHRADILHGINDPGPNFCPSCGGEGTMRKQFAAPTIHFKGSGWAKKDRGAASASTRASRASTGDKPDAKPDAKPDHKGEHGSEHKHESKSESKGGDGGTSGGSSDGGTSGGSSGGASSGSVD